MTAKSVSQSNPVRPAKLPASEMGSAKLTPARIVQDFQEIREKLAYLEDAVTKISLKVEVKKRAISWFS